MLNLNDPPPRRWVEPTIKPAPTARAGIVLQVMEKQGLSDQQLAQLVLKNHPGFLYGDNGTHRFAHGGWALFVQGEHTSAWALMGPIRNTIHNLNTMNRRRVPVNSLLVFTYCALQQGEFTLAQAGINHARLGPLTPPERDDLGMLEQYLRSAA